MSRKSVPTKFGVEVLESRELLSGNVRAAVNRAGDLVVQGDNGDNQFAIVQTADGVEVSGQGGTTINGGGSWIASGVTRDIRINAGGGDDTVHLVDVDVARGLRMNGGQGADMLTRDQTTIEGNVRIRNTEVQLDDAAGAAGLIAAVSAQAQQEPQELNVMMVKLNQACALLTTVRSTTLHNSLYHSTYLAAIDQAMEALYVSSLLVLPTFDPATQMPDPDAEAMFEAHLMMMMQAINCLTAHIDNASLGTQGSKAAAVPARNFIQLDMELIQVIGDGTRRCDPNNPTPTTPGCELLTQDDEGGQVVEFSALEQQRATFFRNIRSPFPAIFFAIGRVPDEQVILTGPLSDGQCASVLKEVQGIKAVVRPVRIPIWVEPWFARRTIIGFRTIWIREFVPAEFIKTISLCNRGGTMAPPDISTRIVLERQLLHFWRFVQHDVTAVA